MTSEASTRSSAGSGRPAISTKRFRANAGCVRTRPDCICSLRLLKHSYLVSQFVCDGGLQVFRPIEEHEHNSSRCSELPVGKGPDLVQSVEGSCPHVTDPYTDLDRFHAELVTKVTLRARHDEADIARLS